MRMTFNLVCLLAVLGGLGCTSKDDETPNPCAFAPIDLTAHGGAAFASAKEIVSSGGELSTTITVKYAQHTIAGCPTNLRSYNGQLVGPTLRVKPGDTLRIKLVNELPPNTDDHAGHMGDHNEPHGFNTTNFHTHGFWVSPKDKSDNVLLKVEPGEQEDYVIEVPAEHPAGTFWYHAHVHGSTALQVASGLQGALIVEGGLDDVPAIKSAADRIFVFQHKSYDEAGVIESYDHVAGPGTWQKTHRQTLVNGQVLPKITMRPGEVERWRFIHAGVHETIMVKLDDHDMYELALDGLALGKVNTWDAIELQPGYRVDVLVKAKSLPEGQTERTHILRDVPADIEASLREVQETERELATVVVRGEPVDMALPTSEEVASLRPHADVTDEELTGDPQKVEFDIADGICPTPGEPCVPCKEGEEGCKTRFMINGREFSDAFVRELKLGTASEWTLSSKLANHPFHIHVNPFQVTRKGPDGKDETVWRDTYLVRDDLAPVKIRSRYRRFTGTFVMHCHILDHEDKGMMELVEVVE